MKSTSNVTVTPAALVVKIVLPAPGRLYGNGTFPFTSTGGSQFTTEVRIPTSLTVSVTPAPGGRCRATQSVVLRARFERHPLTPGGSDGFGVAVHVGVGPTCVCGGGMTVAVEVGGRGVGVAGVGVFGARVGGDVGGGLVGALGDGVWGAPAVAAEDAADNAEPGRGDAAGVAGTPMQPLRLGVAAARESADRRQNEPLDQLQLRTWR